MASQVSQGLGPIIKWAGGKEKELKYIIPNAPETFGNYFEPFVGGGSVFAAFEADHFFINDRSVELVGLYQRIQDGSPAFYRWVGHITNAWSRIRDYVRRHTEPCDLYRDFREGNLSIESVTSLLHGQVDNDWEAIAQTLHRDFAWHLDVFREKVHSNLQRKVLRMHSLEVKKGLMPDADVHDNIETAFMGALYMYFRCLYNDKRLLMQDKDLAAALFLFIRNYAYGGMFRYNDEGDFNVPYGGMAYNSKSLSKKVDYYRSEALLEHFSRTTVDNLDFEEFFDRRQPQPDDFIFLDPPYDSGFSTYAQNEFTKDDQRRLADYLCNRCKGKWMMVIKRTPFIYSLYDGKGLNINTFNKKYLVSFMNRNDKRAEHLIITNY